MRPRTIAAKDVVTISRYWHTPAIRTTVDVEGIALSTELEDFLKAVADELGPTVSLTRAALAQKLVASSRIVCTKIKEESIKVV